MMVELKVYGEAMCFWREAGVLALSVSISLFIRSFQFLLRFVPFESLWYFRHFLFSQLKKKLVCVSWPDL